MPALNAQFQLPLAFAKVVVQLRPLAAPEAQGIPSSGYAYQEMAHGKTLGPVGKYGH
jgi:hypothetical protein